MNQRFIYSDKADLYLKGKLSGNERIDFEEKMQKDPLLQSEIKLQRDVYHALGEARKAGLKARLNQIPVDQSPWFAGAPFKIAAVVSAFVATSVVMYVTFTPSEEDVVYQVNLDEQGQQIYAESSAKINAPKPSTIAAIAEKSETAVVQEPDESTFTASNEPVAQTEVRKIPTIQRPNVTADFSEDDVQLDYSDFEVPQKQALQGSASMDSEVAIEKVVDKAYPFHYQFYNGKLFLHGDFQDAPYKIMALNTENGRTLFLEYAGYYYRIEEQEAISPLTSITDTSLVKELRRLSTAQ